VKTMDTGGEAKVKTALNEVLRFGQVKRMLKQCALFAAAVLVCLAGFVAIERVLSASFQHCINIVNGDSSGLGLSVIAGTYVRCSGGFIHDNTSEITALATLIIAAFTGTLWIATTRQAQLTKEALIADKRAFVFANDVSSF
jgi:hypothetical protein